MEALPAQQVGTNWTLRRTCTRSDTGAAWNPSSATILVYERNRNTAGTADAGSSSTTIIDDALTQAASFWVGQTLLVTDATDGTEVLTEVTAFNAITDTLTFGELPFTVVVGDTYELLGYPLLPEVAATVSTNEVNYQLTTASGVYARPRSLVIVIHYDMGTDDKPEVYSQEVLANR